MSKQAQKRRVQVSAPQNQWRPASAAARKNVVCLAGLLSKGDDWTKAAIDEAIFEDVDGTRVVDARIPSPGHLARIEATNNAGQDICQHAELLHYFGDGLLCFPFTATFSAEIAYSVSKADYAKLPVERKRKAKLVPKGKAGGICTEGCTLHIKALATIDLDAKGQTVIGSAGASPKDLQHIVATTCFGVGAIRAVRIVSFGDRFLKK
ncbi:MAG: hypothetical protein WCN95_02650 [bacterium]